MANLSLSGGDWLCLGMGQVGLFYCGAHRFDLFWAGQWSSWVKVAMGVVWPIWVGLICFEF